MNYFCASAKNNVISLLSMKNQVQSNVIINLIRTVTMTLLSFVTFPYICRVLGDSALGAYSWAAAFVYYFVVLAKVAIPNIAVRECVKVRNDPDELSTKVQEFFIIQSVATIISFGLMTLLVFTIPALRESKTLIFILSIGFLTNVLTFEWVFQSYEKHTYLAIRSIIIACVVDIIIFATIRRPENVVLYSFLVVLTSVLTMLSNLVYMPKIVKFKKARPYNFKQYLPILSVLLIIAFVGSLYDKTDTFILGLIDPSKASVGSYTVGVKSIEIVLGIVMSLSAVFVPRAVYYQEKQDEKQFNNLNMYAGNITLLIVLPAIAFSTTLAGSITKVISGLTGYEDSGTILIVLASMMATFAICNIIYTQILIPQKKEKYYLYIILASVVLNAALSCIFGIVVFKNNPAIGVAVGTAVTDFLMMSCLIALTWKNSKQIIFNTNNIKLVVLAGLISITNILIKQPIEQAFLKSMDMETTLWVEIFVVLLIDAVIYVFGLILTKEKFVRSLKLKR